MYSASISAVTKLDFTSTHTNNGKKSSAPSVTGCPLLPAAWDDLTAAKIVEMAAKRYSNFSSGESAACSLAKYCFMVFSAVSPGRFILGYT